MTMVGEEAVEIYLKRAVIELFKSNGTDKTLLFLGFRRALVDGVVNTAEVDKIKSSSAENKESLKIEGVNGGSYIVNKSALGGKLELRHSTKLAVNRCGVCEKVGLELDVAFFADFLLLGFGLYW